MNQMWSFVIGPVAIHLCTALCLLVLRGRTSTQRLVSFLGSFSALLWSLSILLKTGATQVMAMQIGGWPAPFGISFVADPLASIMLLGLGLVSTVTSFYKEKSDLQRVFLHFMYMGCAGAFLTGDLFNLYVWFEVFLMASYSLMSLELGAHSKAALKNYVVVNAVGSVMMLLGLGLLYASVGSLNMADVAQKLSAGDALDRVRPFGVLLFVAFLIKAAALPFSSWLFVSYPKSAAWVTALFSALLTKVGLYSIIRVFVLVIPINQSMLQPLLLGLGVTTMFVGVLAAASQFKVRQILSAHVTSQIGYILIAIGLGTQLSLAAAVFFIFNQMVVKTGLFLATDAFDEGEGSEDIRQMGGLFERDPNLGLAFFVLALSLAGLPPLSGFAAKVFVFNAALDARAYVSVAIGALTSFFTLYSMIKIWSEVFAKPGLKMHERSTGALKISMSRVAPVLILATLTIVLGLGSGFLMKPCSDAADVILDRNIYIRGVLGVAQ